MGLQLDLGCRRAGAGFGREVVRAALIVDVICGLLRRRLRGQRLLWLRNGGSDGDRHGGGRGTRKWCAVYDVTLVVHDGGLKGRGGKGENEIVIGWTSEARDSNFIDGHKRAV